MILNVQYLDNWEKHGEAIDGANPWDDAYRGKYVSYKSGEEYSWCNRTYFHPFLRTEVLPVYDNETKQQVGWMDKDDGQVYKLPWLIESTRGNSGYDLRAAILEPVVIKPNTRALIPNGIKISFGEGFDSNVEFQIRARSGLAYKKGIMIVNGIGTIDYNYRGEIGTILYNSGTEDFVVNRGDRISQGVICPIYKPEIEIVDLIDTTDRGTRGFGSSGVK